MTELETWLTKIASNAEGSRTDEPGPIPQSRTNEPEVPELEPAPTEPSRLDVFSEKLAFAEQLGKELAHSHPSLLTEAESEMDSVVDVVNSLSDDEAVKVAQVLNEGSEEEKIAVLQSLKSFGGKAMDFASNAMKNSTGSGAKALDFAAKNPTGVGAGVGAAAGAAGGAISGGEGNRFSGALMGGALGAAGGAAGGKALSGTLARGRTARAMGSARQAGTNYQQGAANFARNNPGLGARGNPGVASAMQRSMGGGGTLAGAKQNAGFFQRRRLQKMEKGAASFLSQLPKLAQSFEKNAMCDTDWIKDFEGSPLLPQAISLAQEEIQLDSEPDEYDQIREAREEKRRQLRTQKRMLELQLVAHRNGLDQAPNPEEQAPAPEMQEVQDPSLEAVKQAAAALARTKTARVFGAEVPDAAVDPDVSDDVRVRTFRNYLNQKAEETPTPYPTAMGSGAGVGAAIGGLSGLGTGGGMKAVGLGGLVGAGFGAAGGALASKLDRGEIDSAKTFQGYSDQGLADETSRRMVEQKKRQQSGQEMMAERRHQEQLQAMNKKATAAREFLRSGGGSALAGALGVGALGAGAGAINAPEGQKLDAAKRVGLIGALGGATAGGIGGGLGAAAGRADARVLRGATDDLLRRGQTVLDEANQAIDSTKAPKNLLGTEGVNVGDVDVDELLRRKNPVPGNNTKHASLRGMAIPVTVAGGAQGAVAGGLLGAGAGALTAPEGKSGERAKSWGRKGVAVGGGLGLLGGAGMARSLSRFDDEINQVGRSLRSPTGPSRG